MSTTSEANEAQVAKYQDFLTNGLAQRLNDVQLKKQMLDAEINEYQVLEEVLEQPQPPRKVLVDVGAGYRVRGKIKGAMDRIFVEVGLGFYVEMDPREAENAISYQINWLTQKKRVYEKKEQQILQDMQEYQMLLEFLKRSITC